jgi:hypothetical protein
MLMRSSVYVEGSADVALGRRASARLVLGDSPYVAPLHTLGIAADPVFTAFLSRTRGLLDDHLECWFVTTEQPGAVFGEPLESVSGLGLSTTWLEPPAAAPDHS